MQAGQYNFAVSAKALSSATAPLIDLRSFLLLDRQKIVKTSRRISTKLLLFRLLRAIITNMYRHMPLFLFSRQAAVTLQKKSAAGKGFRPQGKQSYN